MFSATFMPEVRRWANEWVRQNIVFVSNTKPKSANARVRQNFLFLSGLEKFDFIFLHYYIQLKWTKHFREAKLVGLLRGEAKNINGNAKSGSNDVELVLPRTMVFVRTKRQVFTLFSFKCCASGLPAAPLRPNCIGVKKARNSFANSRTITIRTRNLVIQTIRMRLAIADSFYPQLVLTLNPSQVQNCR